MKRALAVVGTVALVLAATAWAQHPGGEEHPGGEQRPGEQYPGAQPHAAQPPQGEMEHPGEPHNPPRANQGRIPPPPPPRPAGTKPEAERREGRVNDMPHVSNDHWYGHDRPDDRRYHLDHPFEHGHFAHFGPTYRYNIVRIDPNLHRFWLPSGEYFEVPAWDWPLAAGWCWTCNADDFVIYEDPDHPGWYLLYDLATGAFVHALFLGA